MFYTFCQNNSGGYFIENDEFGICEVIIIEANTKQDAINYFRTFEEKESNFNDFCFCCGMRWNFDEMDLEEYSYPSIFNIKIENIKKDWLRERCFVHNCYNKTFYEYRFKD